MSNCNADIDYLLDVDDVLSTNNLLINVLLCPPPPYNKLPRYIYKQLESLGREIAQHLQDVRKAYNQNDGDEI